MSRKNHEMIDGKLLQTDKKYAQLKLKQKEKIAEWMFQATRDYYMKKYTFPNDKHLEEVVDIVYEKIEDAEIWIPYGEVFKHYKSKRSDINKRIRRSLNEKEESRIEKVCFMNMCMIQDDKGNVLALDKVNDSYTGTTFPGGHVEQNEIFQKSMIREVWEETGLTIETPKLCGLYHWHKGGKNSLYNANEIKDIKENPVVESVLLAPIKAIPVLGDLIDSSTNKLLNDFQQKKEQELLDVILQDDHSITSEMVNDVEFIINFARAKEAVQRLATTDKVEYFGNLIRNGYLQGKHIDGSIFDEYIHILNTMSYREIQYLVEYKKYCEDSSKRGKSTKHINGRTYSNKYESFCNEYSKQIKVSPGEVDYVFLHIKQTGFIEEEFETESGDVDENDNTFDSLDVESKGYYITKEFLDFYEMVLKRNENNG